MRTLPTLALVLSLGLTGLAAPNLLRTADAAPPQDHGQEDHTPLQDAMGTLQGNQRKLRKLVSDVAANKAELLAATEEMENAILVAYAQPVPFIEKQEGDRKAAMQADYKRTMAKLLIANLDLREAALKGDGAAAAAAAQAMGELKKTGHDTYNQ